MWYIHISLQSTLYKSHSLHDKSNVEKVLTLDKLAISLSTGEFSRMGLDFRTMMIYFPKIHLLDLNLCDSLKARSDEPINSRF